MLKYRSVRIMLRSLLVLAIVAIPLGTIGFGVHWVLAQHNDTAVTQSAKSHPTATSQKLSQKSTTTKQPTQPTKVDWHASSEKKAYPNLKEHPNLWIRVSIKDQRVYLKDGSHVLYTMLASTGSGKSATPTGTYAIQPERGDHFYNAESGEGANYWVSWKDHGIYLFHSVPVDRAGHYVVKEAEELGKKANSHGCVRLTIVDAKWMSQNIPVGTKVVIK